MKVVVGLAAMLLIAGFSILAFTRTHGNCFTLSTACEASAAVPK